ncbi:hypothetical protein NE237_029499 [Protea cynaroides]|uniref:Cytochrome P450 n=1 Tax=Protea cynaroides TaxID=273540 RepID=A0A9Q0JV54_9MAGN|nr:hypothetical protein NE237_029499 [Protea cynaroides]
MFSLLLVFVSVGLLTWVFTADGNAWKHGRNQRGRASIPGPRGLPVFGSLLSLSCGLAHRTLASMASTLGATQLMAFSLGSTPVVVSSDPHIAREILTSPHSLTVRLNNLQKCSCSAGLLRTIASSHLFAPKRIAAHESGRQLDCATMLQGIMNEQSKNGAVLLRMHLQAASLNNIMGSVFGKRYNVARESHEFNFSDYLPSLSYFYDPFCINQRCAALVPRVRSLVRGIIEEHQICESDKVSDNADFVDVLLSLDGEVKLQEDDMIAVLWEMIFRGTDTTALLTEWVMTELAMNPDIQAKLQQELDKLVGDKGVTDADMVNLPYLQSVIKDTLRIHPPGPLLSWARLSTSDVQLSNNMLIPAHTTAMVNMWAITYDPMVWEDPLVFKPERFMEKVGGENVDVRGNDLRQAPFGAGSRVCPGKNLGMVTVSLWVANLVQHFYWVPNPEKPVDFSEVLKLSCEIKNPLSVVAVHRNVLPL